MLTGTNPFAGADAATTLVNITQQRAAGAELARAGAAEDGGHGAGARADEGSRRGGPRARAGSPASCAGAWTISSRAAANHREAMASPLLAKKRSDLLPLEEDRGGLGVWWIVAALGAAPGGDRLLLAQMS